MPNTLLLLANGCEELEAVTVIDLLRRAQIEVVTAGLQAGPVTASRGTVLVPETTLEAVQEQSFDLVVLPGGLPGARYLEEDPRVLSLLQRHAAAGHVVAAICAAPKVLAVAGLLDGRRATAYPGCVNPAAFPQVTLVADAVVVDGRIVTSRGPGTAMDFALCLIGLLMGEARRQDVESELVRGR